jgi:bifunctional non-homologous end joining protein LigD
MMSEAEPERFLPTLKKVDRRGRILLDWLRNGLGATAVASFCPRARPGATVATPLTWDEVTDRLDPQQFNLQTVPQRLAGLRTDAWQGFAGMRQKLPDFAAGKRAAERHGATNAQQAGRSAAAGKAVIVTASRPKRRA